MNIFKNKARKALGFFLLTALLISFGFVKKVEATHAAGGEVLYEHVAGNTYKIIFKFYRDCTGAQAPTNFTVCYESQGCNIGVQTLSLPLAAGPVVVSNGCPAYGTTCSTPVGSIPGYEEYIYETQVTLQPCNFWRFWGTLNARNPMDWLSGGTLIIDATLDNSTGATTPDDSPYFSVKPVPYCCVGVPFTYNNGAVDVNGDSLVYESVNPLTGGLNCQTWNPPTYPTLSTYSPSWPVGQTGNPLTNPIPTNNTFTINPQTGAISFTPSHQGKGVITIKCTSYRNGQLIGFVKRDIQVVVLSCNPGLIPNVPIDSLSLVNATVDSAGRVTACSGDSLAFCFKLGSSDTAALLVPYSNITASMPGATITYSGVYTDSITGCINWQTSQADTGLHVLVLSIIDSSCQPPGILHSYSFTIPVFIDYGIQAFGDTIICAGDQAQLSVTGGGDKQWDVLPGGSPITSLSCTQCDNPIATPTLPTYYVVEGCDKDTVFVDIAGVPSLTITDDTTTCVNANLQLEVLAAPPNQTYSFSWTPATSLSATNIFNPVVQNLMADQVYTVTVTPHGANGPLPACASTASVEVDVLLGFSAAIDDSILCEGLEVSTITGSSMPSAVNGRVYTFAWTPLGDMTSSNTINTVITPNVPGGVYTITASYPGCPDSSIAFPIFMDPVPVVDAGIDREMCLNDTIHLNSSVFPDTLAYTIAWSPGADMNSSTIADPVYSGKVSQNLTVIYTSPLGCADTNMVRIDINNVDFLQLDGDRSICPGDTAALSVIGALSYQWFPNYYINSTGNVSNVQVNPPVTQEYSVVGIDFKGCYDTATVNVLVNAGSVVDAGEDVTIFPGETVTLNARGNASVFNWFPPSGLSSTTVQNPVATPNATTRYYVSAETEYGCPTYDSVTVIVSAQSLIDLPNAFSPGSGTSINDVLNIRKRGIVRLKRWDIFNRWGERVFTTRNIDQGWNGQYNSEPQPTGTYVYVIEAVTSTGKRFSKQGNVTLVR